MSHAANIGRLGIIEAMVEYCAVNSPLPQAITAQEVGHTAAFLLSPLGSGITGTTIYVDKGYHAMGKAEDTRWTPPNEGLEKRPL